MSDWIASKTGSKLANTAGEPIYAEELNPENPDDAQWLGAADNGSVLVIGGDNLVAISLCLLPCQVYSTIVLTKSGGRATLRSTIFMSVPA